MKVNAIEAFFEGLKSLPSHAWKGLIELGKMALYVVGKIAIAVVNLVHHFFDMFERLVKLWTQAPAHTDYRENFDGIASKMMETELAYFKQQPIEHQLAAVDAIDEVAKSLKTSKKVEKKLEPVGKVQYEPVINSDAANDQQQLVERKAAKIALTK